MNLGVALLVLHVFLAVGIITLVLLQRGKGASEGAMFGGGASTVFGASGSANFLSKTTAILATLFFINSLALAYMAANREAPVTVVDTIQEQVSTDSQAIEAEIPGDVPAPEATDDGDVPPAE